MIVLLAAPVPALHAPIVFIGAGPEVDATRGVIAAEIASLKLDASYSATTAMEISRIVEPPPAFETALGRVFVDLRGADRTTVYVVDGAWQRVLVRHVPKRSETDAVARETVGQIVRSTLDALLHGATIGVDRHELAEPQRGAPPAPHVAPRAPLEPLRPIDRPTTTAPAREQSAERRLGLDASVAWSAEPSASDQATHGVSTRVFAHAPVGAASLGASISLDLRTSIEARTLDASVRIRPTIVSLGPELWSRGRVRFGGALLLSLAITRQDSSVPQGRAAPSATFVSPSVRALTGVAVPLAQRLSLFAVVGAVVDLQRERYLLERGGSREVVFEPWPVRPLFSVGLSSNVIGE